VDVSSDELVRVLRSVALALEQSTRMLVRITDLYDEAAVVHGQLADALADLEPNPCASRREQANDEWLRDAGSTAAASDSPSHIRSEGLSLCQGLGRTAHRHRRFERINNLS
jgi:hypothetical protein